MSKSETDEMLLNGGQSASHAPAAVRSSDGEKEERQQTASAAAGPAHADTHPAAAAAASAVALCSLHRLATVELQLVMQHCDRPTLLGLARCSRRTLAAASHDFAWKVLSPLHFDFSADDTPDLGARLRGSRLLSHCDVSLRMVGPDDPWSVTAAELAAIESVPRLIALDTRARNNVSPHDLERLLSHPALGGLTTLHPGFNQLDGHAMALLPINQPRLRVLSFQGLGSNHDPGEFWPPLSQLPLLADLSVHSFSNIDVASLAAALAVCPSLRRLCFSGARVDNLAALMSPTLARQLQSLALDHVFGENSSAAPSTISAGAATAAAIAAAESWTAVFANLRDLRSLSLRRRCADLGSVAMTSSLAAALQTGDALRSLTALRIDSLAVDKDGGSLLPLLVAHCPQLRRLHFSDSNGTWSSLGSLAGLPLLAHLSDLRLLRFAANDHPIVSQCVTLRTLHLTKVHSNELHSILGSPQMRQLESLTLQSVWIHPVDNSAAPLDWSLCVANLCSLRTLNLDDCNAVNRLLAAIQAVHPPALRRIRFLHPPSVEYQPELPLLSELLAQLPSLVIGLLVEPVSNFSRPCLLESLRAEWARMARAHPTRVAITQLTAADGDPFSSWTD